MSFKFNSTHQTSLYGETHKLLDIEIEKGHDDSFSFKNNAQTWVPNLIGHLYW